MNQTLNVGDLDGHTLILGTNGYGKTVLGKYLCAITPAKIWTAALDVEGEYTGANYLCDDFDKFQMVVDKFIKKNKTRKLYEVFRKPIFHIFIEEAHEYKGVKATALIRWAKRIRKYGGKIYFIGQRCIDVEKSVRSECKSYVVFNQSVGDIGVLSETTNSKVVGVNAPRLKEGQFFVRGNRHGDIGLYSYAFDKRCISTNGVRIHFEKTILAEKLDI